MSRGFGAKESRVGGNEFDRAAASYYNQRTGFGASEEVATAKQNFYNADQLPSRKAGNIGPSEGESYAVADTKYILSRHPDSKKVSADLDKGQAIAAPRDEAADAQRAALRAASNYPELHQAMTKATYDRALARSMDVKVRTQTLSRNADTKDAYADAWKAARDAFDAGDAAAKSMLKTGDDSYKEVREWRGPTSKVNLEQTDRKLPDGRPSIPGRVAAVNAGINAANAAVEKILGQAKFKNLSLDQKGFIARAIYDRMVSDKHAFLVVRNYISKTELYQGPGTSRPVTYLNQKGDWV